MSDKDGGAAFPRPFSKERINDEYSDTYDAQEGLSLRDYFAAKAMAAIIAAEKDNPPTNKQLADTAYMIADAMIEARKL